jgi:hypothetical protein
MGPAVMLGQGLTEVAGPVCDSAVTDLAAGDWKMGNGHRGTAGRRLADHLDDARPAGVISGRAHAAHAARQKSTFAKHAAIYIHAYYRAIRSANFVMDRRVGETCRLPVHEAVISHPS